MSTVMLATSLGLLFVGLLLLAVNVAPGSRSGRVERSLALIDGTGRPGAQQGGTLATVQAGPAGLDFSDRVMRPTVDRARTVARRLTPRGLLDGVGHRLDLAGNPKAWPAERLMAVKGLGLFAGAGLGLLYGLSVGGAWVLLAPASVAAAGLFLPDLLVGIAGDKRQQQIQRELPDTLDLLTISVEAGLGFDAALYQAASNTGGPLSGEFFRVLQEMQLGASRAEAFASLNRRTEVDELDTFVQALEQADELGVPIAQVLREQAREMRVKRQQRAEERAQKVPVKISIPLVLFILPCLFLVILGPAGLQIAGMT